ncbi:Uncharacterised protein [Rikenella microfusus]|uniref:Uncharacterized protein n=1 Tax=Rikenella microfusus TaxID=28139 RepID=A0A379MQG2_9BACT|nr:Uncharacterised protein [Rikenella microfusus]
MAGASGAATGTAQLQAYAGSSSGLPKGKLYTKSYS